MRGSRVGQWVGPWWSKGGPRDQLVLESDVTPGGGSLSLLRAPL